MIDFLFSHTPLLYLTQSLWRDEAFSVLVAEHSIPEIIRLTAGDFTPPLHYILLHIWIGLFGSSEIAVRLLATVFYAATIVLSYYFSRHFLFKNNHQKSFVLAFFVAINPLVMYYGFEARMYSQLVFFVLLATYFLLARSWKWFASISLLALYTHPYALFALAAHGAWVLFDQRSDLKKFIVYAGSAVVLFMPWLVILTQHALSSGDTWYSPVSRDQVLGIFGNLYTGYEGTPDGFWWLGKVLTLMIIATVVYGVARKIISKQARLLLSIMTVPVGIVLLISLITPLYVGRYILYASAAQSLLIGYIMLNISAVRMRNGIISASIGATIWFLVWFPPYIEKTPFRDTFSQIREEYGADSVVMVRAAHNYPDAVYYISDKDQVYIYHPDNETVPAYIGTVLIPLDRVVDSLPTERGVIVYDDGSYESFDQYKTNHEY